MTVEHEPAVASRESIFAAVANTGMEASEWNATAVAAPTWQERTRLVLAAGSGLLIAAAFATHLHLHGSFADALLSGHGDGTHELPLPSLALYAAAALAGAWFVLPRAWVALRSLRPDMNLLMTAAVVGAMLLGEWFEAAMVAFLFSVALLLEQWSIGRARKAVASLVDLAPTRARYVCPHDGDILEKPVEEVPVGVLALVRPGEKIPLDGRVEKGGSAVNQAPVTGEASLVEKQPGDEVFAGSLNGAGALEIRVTRSAADGTLARIAKLIDEARANRARAEQWVERFARIYTPAMMLFAAAIAILPPMTGLGGWGDWIYRGLAVLVIACPCALVISTPVCFVAGLTAAARRGILVKGGEHLEAAGRLVAIALDKTGTLTRGRPEVAAVVPLSGHDRQEVLRIAAALESESEHPLARAIRRKAEEEGFAVERAESYTALPGRGGEARLDGRLFWIGNHRLLHEKGVETAPIHAQAEALEREACSVVAVGEDRHVCGLIGLRDEVRPNAAEAVKQLRDTGIGELILLTGDHEVAAAQVAQRVGLNCWRAGLLPEEKVAAVIELAAGGRQVGMIGDGVNDAPAMAAATTGIAMAALGTDVAIETADIALMRDDLGQVAWLVRHSRRTLATIRANIAFALGLKLLFVILALGGFASLWLAIAADTGASLLVIANGLRLLKDIP